MLAKLNYGLFFINFTLTLFSFGIWAMAITILPFLSETPISLRIIGIIMAINFWYNVIRELIDENK